MKARESELSATFVALADTLVNDFDYADLAHVLASTCVDLLGADTAGILLMGPGGTLQVVASSDERTRSLELFELQNEEGPCTDCYRTGDAVRVPDLMASGRWPRFTHRAISEGFLSVDAFPLRLRDTRLGALNLFGTEKGGLDDVDRTVAQALADVATIGLLQERAVRESELLADQLRHALNSRVTIEQAKGVLAEQGQCTVSEAFELLRARARSRSTAVREVAARVVAGDVTYDDLV